MSLRWAALTVLCICLLAVGQMLFKAAATQWRIEGLTWTTLRSFFSPAMVLALITYAVTTLLWVYILRSVALSIAFPFYALAFILVPVLSWFMFDEPLTARVLAGGALIVAGVIVVAH